MLTVAAAAIIWMQICTKSVMIVAATLCKIQTLTSMFKSVSYRM